MCFNKKKEKEKKTIALKFDGKYKKGIHLKVLSIQAPSLEANWRNEFLVSFLERSVHI